MMMMMCVNNWKRASSRNYSYERKVERKSTTIGAPPIHAYI